jgi:GT2 family glycosyltransferase
VAGEDPKTPALLHASLLQLVNESRQLGAVRDALRDGAVDVALRHVDRAWRCEPENAATLAPIYGRLLLLEGSDHEAALNLLRRAVDLKPNPDTEALIAVALLQLERPREARRTVESALANSCVAPGGLLFHAAGRVMRHPAIAAPGWIGRGPRLEFLGELNDGELDRGELYSAHAASTLALRFDGATAFTPIARIGLLAGTGGFRFRIPRLAASRYIEAESGGLALLGSGARLPPCFALDGRITEAGGRLGGWARLGWSPSMPLKLRLDDGRVSHTTRASNASGAEGTFDVPLREVGLLGSCIDVSARLPDGRWQPLPDSPLLLESAVRLKDGRTRRPLASELRFARAEREATLERAACTDIIVPVYGGRDATLACLESVLATLDDTTSLTVVDDATEDLALIAGLDSLAADGRITLLRNATNQGFAASVNRGLALHPTHDAIVLNSDTLVFADWLARLRAAAYSDRAVGTVTPFSNSGSIASYPEAQDAPFDAADAAALHALAAATHDGTRADIPVGVGFCLYLRRDCLREVGTFDDAVFGDGYGEETDFCMRARAHGWLHRLAADVFVYHAGGVSFGGRRAALLNRSQRLINLRHPGYDRFIADFLADDPLRPLRRRLDERRLFDFAGQFLLVLTLALTGGVERFVNERSRRLRARGLHALVLRPAAANDARHCVLQSDALVLPNLRYDIPEELPALDALLRKLGLAGIEIQHFLHLDPRLIESVRALPVPYEVYVHDYAWLCPRVTLIDGSGRYCGEPELAVCEACVRENGSQLGESIGVAALRTRSAGWLGGARRVVVPSTDTAMRMERHFAGVTVSVEAHTSSARAAANSPPVRVEATRSRLRVALIGAIGEHKGYRVLRDCARDARARALPLEFVVIGYTEDDAALLETGQVFITGRYGDGEPPHLLRREDPDVIWMASVWPETWCYTLDYALESGLPVAAFDTGAIAERLRAAGHGEFLPLQLEPARINDRLLALRGASRPASLTASRSRKTPLAAAINVDIMTAAQPQVEPMKDPTEEKPSEVVSPVVQPNALAASVQVLPLPVGLYLFSVTPSDPPGASATGRLRLPAMQVGLGPGVPPDQVEFMAGPGTEAAWLIAPTDLLVVKVNGVGATLILNSVRAPDGGTLSIKVERLSGRTSTVARAPSAPREEAPRDGGSSGATFADGAVDLPLAVQIGAHICTRGDMNFTNVPWAGRIAPGLWIESFTVRPLERFEPKDIEYKALTGSGFETPWVSDGAPCGTRGMGVPLVAFALRFKGSVAAGFDCEYSGYFQSGVTVGPLRNGAPCRSTVANDPLEGIQVRLVKRAAAGNADPATAGKRPPVVPAARTRAVHRHAGRGS